MAAWHHQYQKRKRHHQKAAAWRKLINRYQHGHQRERRDGINRITRQHGGMASWQQRQQQQQHRRET